MGLGFGLVAHHASEGSRLGGCVSTHRRAAERRPDRVGAERPAIEIAADLDRLCTGGGRGRAGLLQKLQRERLTAHGRAERLARVRVKVRARDRVRVRVRVRVRAAPRDGQQRQVLRPPRPARS